MPIVDIRGEPFHVRVDGPAAAPPAAGACSHAARSRFSFSMSASRVYIMCPAS